ncbi:MAG: sulfatase-like hydrolase/transferase, partial [Magnetococcales bacterium]|nr:sulfatase-like hydrolase/transferase [Magnetococcales bacterium]
GQNKGISVSPVFGGYTSQAEFEFLCGVPAFQEFDQIEFNTFTGAPTYCLPGILKDFGYATVASNGFKPDFFNTVPAYRGLGFESAYFSKEYTPTSETYLSKGDDTDNKYFYDGDLYDQNLAFVKTLLDKKKPFFNYVLTVYGHLPFDLGRRAGPPLFSLPALHPDLQKIVNQNHYRTQALARYLQELIALDPESLIVLAADHLPPLSDGTQDYLTYGYLPALPDPLHSNLFLVFDKGRPVKPTERVFSHFNIYRLILDHLTDHEYCRIQRCAFDAPYDKEPLRDDYRIIMGLASR